MPDHDQQPDNGEFQRHVYDKLWENINQKENRLWTFLAVYGGAIGIAFGTGAAQNLKPEIGFVLLSLTYWALEIILGAEWWSARNRLMIRGIELQNQKAIVGVIPTFYIRGGYIVEPLLNASLLIISAVGLIIFSMSVKAFDGNATVVSKLELAKIILNYFAFSWFVIRITHYRETRIREYFRTLKDLNIQLKTKLDAGEINNLDLYDLENSKLEKLVEIIDPSKDFIRDKEIEDKTKHSFRVWSLVIYTISTFMISRIFFNLKINVFHYNFISLNLFNLFMLFYAIILFVCLYQNSLYNKYSSLYGFPFLEMFKKNKQKPLSYEKYFQRYFWSNFLILVFFIGSVIFPLIISFLSSSLSWA